MYRRLWFFLFTLLMLQILLAVPSSLKKYPVRLPDGEVIYLRSLGDEYGYIEVTEDNYTVMKGADGYYYFALVRNGKLVPSELRVKPMDKRSKAEIEFLQTLQPFQGIDIIQEQIRKARSGFAKMMKTNTSLTLRNYPEKTVNKLLVILVDFSDLSATETKEDIQRVFVEKNYKGYGCVNDYFEEVSAGLFGIDADIAGWYTASNPHDYYGKENPKYYDHVRELVMEAIRKADADGVDFSQYDNDGDGFVDGLTIIHAGEGAEASNKTNIWSHRGFISPVQLDGVTINSYTIQPEKQYGHRVDIGIICHEYGHVLGLPDMYDPSNQTRGIGIWGLMGYGSWGGNMGSPYLPVHLSALSKIQLGWARLTEIKTDSLQVPIEGVELTNQVIQIPFPANKGYYVLENRRKVGFDRLLPGDGLLIWKKEGWKINLIQADGRYDLEKKNNSGDAGDPYPGSSNNHELTRYSNPPSNFSDSVYTGIDITDISMSQDKMIMNIYRVIKEPRLELVDAWKLYHVNVDSGKISEINIKVRNTGDGVLKWKVKARKGKPVVIGPMTPGNNHVSFLQQDHFRVVKAAAGGLLKPAASASSVAGDKEIELKYDLAGYMPVYMLGSSSLSKFYIATRFANSTGSFKLDSLKVYVKTGLSDEPFEVSVHLTNPSNGMPGKKIFSHLIHQKSVWGEWITIPVSSDISFEANEKFWITATFPFSYLSPIGITGSGTGESVGNNYYSYDGIHWQKLGDVVHTNEKVEDDAYLVRAYGKEENLNFITFQPDSGEILPGDTANIKMIIDARQITAKTYYFDLIFSTNQVFDNHELIYFTEINVSGKSSQELESPTTLTKDFELESIYPNPFNPITNITIRVNQEGNYSIKIFNLMGQEIAEILEQKELKSGIYHFKFEASEFSSGIYFLSVSNGIHTISKKLILLK